MKNLVKKLKEKLTIITGTVFASILIGMNNVYATSSNTGSIDAFINFACDWLTKIGGVVALVGRSNVCFRLAKRRCRGKIKRTYDTYGRIYASSNCTI